MKAVRWRGPDDVQVVDIGQTDGAVTIRVTGALGFDADIFMGWGEDGSSEGSYWDGLWRGLGQWGVSMLREVTVTPGQITVYSDKLDALPLMGLTSGPLGIPVTANPPDGDAWLSPITTQFTLRPSNDSVFLQHWAESTWASGSVNLRVHVDRVHVQAGEAGWRSLVKAERANVHSLIHYLSQSSSFSTPSFELTDPP